MKMTLKCYDALKVDLQQSTPLLQGGNLDVSESREVKTPWPPDHHWSWAQRSQGFLLLLLHGQCDTSQAHFFWWRMKAKKVAAVSKNRIPGTAFCSDPFFCTAKHVYCTEHLLLTKPCQWRTEWHPVWQTRPVKGGSFSFFALFLPWRITTV